MGSLIVEKYVIVDSDTLDSIMWDYKVHVRLDKYSNINIGDIIGIKLKYTVHNMTVAKVIDIRTIRNSKYKYIIFKEINDNTNILYANDGYVCYDRLQRDVLPKLYLIVGKSGSGKDHVVNDLKCNENLSRVISRTTRKPRYEGENNYIFVDHNKNMNKIYAKRGYTRTLYAGNFYYILYEDLLGRDLYIIEPEGAKLMNQYGFNDIEIWTLYLDVNPIKRFFNMVKRGDSFMKIIKRLWNDHKHFKGFNGDVNFKTTSELYEYIKRNKF